MNAYGPPRRVSDAGRELLRAAVSIDHDWSLPFSSATMLGEAVGGLSNDDLAGAYLLAQSLQEAISCVQIRRDMERDPDHPGSTDVLAPP